MVGKVFLLQNDAHYLSLGAPYTLIMMAFGNDDCGPALAEAYRQSLGDTGLVMLHDLS